MKNLTFILLLFLFSSPLSGQHLAGSWDGHIAIQGNKLIIKTHFQQSDGGHTGTIDVPQQGASDLALQNIRLTDADSVFFEFKAGPGLAKFNGRFRGDSAITGTFHQRGMQFPFDLNRMDSESVAEKENTSELLPYNHKEVIIKNDSIAIGGTLTWPKNAQSDQLVIMISGSGAQDRNGTIKPITDFQPYAVLADSLTAGGLATFRYDDRGVGQSTGNFGNTTLGMLADDVHAIIAKFTNGKKYDFEQIILLGHSQGGVVAGKVAAANDRVDNLILMASTGVPLKEVLRFQVQQAFKNAPVDSNLVAKEIDAREQLMEAIKNGEEIKEAQQNYQERFAAIQMATGADSTQANQIAVNQAQQLRSYFSAPQTQSLLFYNPAADLSKLNIPVLVLFGGKDTQVTIEMNKTPIVEALEKAEAKYTLAEFGQANHLFQKAKTGNTSEYGSLDKKFMDGFLETIEEWIKK